MKNLISILVISVVAACSKGPKADPCDAKAIANLGANDGHRLALAGCTFQSQGNDIVAFGDTTGKGRSVDCVMKGGKDGVDDFRHAAMKLDMAKLKLDVEGTVAGGAMKDCVISAHE
jgi:hypothetical protein